MKKPAARPSLNALRAFEAAARLLSFQDAASELHVTPAALSHQVRQLEAQLGLKLFNRQHRAVSLTAAGKRLQPELRDAFATIDRAIRDVQQRSEPNTLTVASHLAPMCSPTWLAEHPLATPADLIGHTLIDDQTHLGGDLSLPVWEDWLRAAGVRKKARNRVAFNVADHTLDAAAAGGGVVLGRTVLARTDLASGRLVCPFDLQIPTGFAFYAVSPDARADDPLVQQFINWLKERFCAD